MFLYKILKCILQIQTIAMTPPIDGVGFRHTFIFKKGDITGPLKTRLEKYFSNYRNEIESYEKADVIYTSNFFLYEETLMIDDLEEGSTHIAPCLILVFYGADWYNFINDLLAFQELFPEKNLPRQNDYNYVIRDEKKLFDDFQSV